MSDFLSDYRYFTSADYAPDEFHDWCGLYTLSASLSRKVWIRLGRFVFFPNLYIIIVGKPGMGKDSSMEVSRDIIREVNSAPISVTCQSKEDLVRELSECLKEYEPPSGPKLKQTPFVIYSPELAQFFNVDANRMSEFLTAVFDARSVYDASTLRHGRQVIPGPYICFCAGAQHNRIHKYIQAGALEEGFARRCNFIVPNKFRERKLEYEITPEHGKARARCVDHCRKATELYGEFKWRDNAKEFARHWFETRRINPNPSIESYDSNIHVQLLKLAMILSVSRGFDMMIELDDIHTALALLERVKVSLPGLMSGVGRSDLAPLRNKIVEMLVSCDGLMPYRQVYAAFLKDFNNETEFVNVINSLRDTGQIESVKAEYQGKVRDCLKIATKPVN